MSSHQDGIEEIRRLARIAERRLRLGGAVHVGVRALCIGLAVAIVAIALRKVGVVAERPAWAVIALDALGVLGAAVAAAARRLPERAGARAIDRFHDLHDRFASALDFGEQSTPPRTPFMQAAIEDAVAAAPTARPRLAVPIALPPQLGIAAVLAAVLCGALLFHVARHAPISHAKTIEPVEMSSDDLDDVQDFLKQIEQNVPSDNTRAAVEEFNKLVDDIAHGRVDRTDAFRRMQVLEDKLLTGSPADKRAFEEGLDRIGNEMKKAEFTKPAGEALADHKLDRARDALRDLANKIRAGQDKPIDKAKLEQMREALKKAVADVEQRRKEIDERRKELADEILAMKQKTADGGSDDDRSLLEKKQRELERLDRDVDARQDARQKLDRLDRELQQAAEDLMKDLGMSAKDLEQGAEDIHRMEEQAMAQEQKEELRQKLQELRELVRQQGQGGKGQLARLQRFGRLARGQGGSQGQGGQQQGGHAEGQDEKGGSQGQGEPQGGPQPQDGNGGSQGAGQAGETWVLGANGEKMWMVSKGQGGKGQESQAGRGGQDEGSDRKWGEGHDSKLQGNATNPKMGTEDTQVQGADTGQGGARSQVILGAAERGFASRRYQRVYTEYHQVAEQALAKDEIPAGFRFYVKRYFQLIRPREGP